MNLKIAQIFLFANIDTASIDCKQQTNSEIFT